MFSLKLRLSLVRWMQYLLGEVFFIKESSYIRDLCRRSISILQWKMWTPFRLSAGMYCLIFYSGAMPVATAGGWVYLRCRVCESKMPYCWFHFALNSLLPSDAIWRQGSGSKLAQVLAWHQAITWTNIDLSLVRFCGIPLKCPSCYLVKCGWKLLYFWNHHRISQGQ